MTSTPTSRSRRTAPQPSTVPVTRFRSADDARRDRAATETQAAAAGTQDPDEFVSSLDDDFLSCRGDRHSFPKLVVRKSTGKLPKGIALTRQHDGCFQITFTCPDCGTERSKTTLPGGRYDPSAQYTYRYPPGYLSPAGSGLSRPDFTTELLRRAFETGVVA